MAEYSVNNSNARFTLKLTLTDGNPNVSDNSSIVTYKLELSANTAWDFINYNITKTVVLDSETVHNETKAYSSGEYNTITLAEGSKKIYHDKDGSKTLSFSYSIDMKKVDHTPGPLSSSGTMTLTSIARKAEVTYSKNFTDEDGAYIEFSNPGGFNIKPYFDVYDKTTDKIVCSFANPIGQYTNPTSIIFSDDGRKYLWANTKNSNTYKVVVGVETFNGPNSLGTSSKEVELTIVNANPVLTADKVSYTDVNNATKALTESNGQTIVSGMSSVNVTCGEATAKKGATIVRYDVSLGSAYKPIHSAAGGTAEVGSVISDTNLILCVTAVDSRGNTSETVKKTVPVYPYSEPKIAYHPNFDYIECARCAENGALDKKGKKLKVAIMGKWSAFPNGKNVGRLEVMYTSKDGESQWYSQTTDDIVGNASNLYITQGKFNGVVNGVTLEVTKSYTVTIRCIDSLGKSAKVSYKIPTQAVDFHLRKGAAFGEYVTEENTLTLSNEWTAKGLYGLGKCVQVSAYADLNNCLDFRVYGVSQSVCNTIHNLPLGFYGAYENGVEVPTASGGILKVYSADGLGLEGNDEGINIIQEYTVVSGKYKFLRSVTKKVTGECIFTAWFLVQQTIERASSSN